MCFLRKGKCRLCRHCGIRMKFMVPSEKEWTLRVPHWQSTYYKITEEHFNQDWVFSMWSVTFIRIVLRYWFPGSVAKSCIKYDSSSITRQWLILSINRHHNSFDLVMAAFCYFCFLSWVFCFVLSFMLLRFWFCQ